MFLEQITFLIIEKMLKRANKPTGIKMYRVNDVFTHREQKLNRANGPRQS